MSRKSTTSKKLGHWSLIAVIAGNTAALVGSMENVYRFFRDLLGVDWLSLGIFVFGLMVATGFVLGSIWVYRNFLAGLRFRRRLTLTVVLALVAAAAVYGNVIILSRHQPGELLLSSKVGLWRERLLRSQTPNGGIRINYRDPAAVPQVWTSSQALTAFLAGTPQVSHRDSQFVKSTFEYIETLRRSDEDEGWGYFHFHKRAVTEIVAWVVLAYTHSLRSENLWSAAEKEVVVRRIERDLALLIRRQHSDGGWSPTKDVSAELTRTYSTVLALWSLVEARRSGIGEQYDRRIDNGIQWLLNTWDERLWWVPNPHRENQIHRYDALSAQVLYVLARAESLLPSLIHDRVYQRARRSFLQQAPVTERAVTVDDHLSDIDQYLLPTDFQIEGSTFLWYPWTLAALSETAANDALDEPSRQLALELRSKLLRKADQILEYVDSGPTYVVAENLFCLVRGLEE